MEQLLHSGSGGRNAGGGIVAYDAGGPCRIFPGINAARVVFEVGTHSPWVQDVIGGCGHEVLVANPRMRWRQARAVLRRKEDWQDTACILEFYRAVS